MAEAERVRGPLTGGRWRGGLRGALRIFAGLDANQLGDPGSEAGSSQLAWGQIPTKSLWGWSERPRREGAPCHQRLSSQIEMCAVQEGSQQPHERLNCG